jgi:hypothetical protein
MAYEELTGKRKLFVDHYLGQANCCKSEAARRAGYACPGQEGYRLFKEPEIREAIDERLREVALGADEILARLSEQARGNMADFVAVETDGFRIDLAEAEKAGKLRLVRRVGFDPKGRPFLELYDSQQALLALAKRYHLLPDRQELSGPDGGPMQVGITYEEALRLLEGGEEPGLQAATRDTDPSREETTGALGL